MTETVAAAPASEPVKAKSPKKRGPKTAGGAAKAKPAHPSTAEMVTSAVGALKERGGSSLRAIKKYISATYKVDADKLAPFIKKYIKSAVAAGKLVQTKGSGASGSFKLPGAASGEGKKKKPASAKPKAKKPAAAKVEKKKSPVKAKAKTTKKPPTTPKAPKPKKATAPKVKSSAAKPKKASPAKKAAKKTAPPKKAAPKKK
ncbi:Histone H1 [Nesidiocoris tenuis]|uniref:Histone H1 n=1 Tax=Nesidiocoris tenuis TaxID=355587 RepID=A0ABN7AEQ8_9HEMI|nr:Histone H1 [Nesidiocoris tenuis]